MTARDTYNSTVQSASKSKISTLTANQAAQQETINGNGCNVGYTLQTGNYTNFASGVKNANQTKRDADFAAEQARQASHAVARDTLRDTGDRAPL